MRRYINTVQTEVGQVDLHYEGESLEGELIEVRLKGQAIAIPSAWSKQTPKTIARKVCNMIRMGQINDLEQFDDEAA